MHYIYYENFITSWGKRPFSMRSTSRELVVFEFRVRQLRLSSGGPVAMSDKDSTDKKPCSFRCTTSSGLFSNLQSCLIRCRQQQQQQKNQKQLKQSNTSSLT